MSFHGRFRWYTKKGRNHQSIKKLCKGINKMLIGTAIRLIDGSLFLLL